MRALEQAPGSVAASVVRRLWFLDMEAPGPYERILPLPYVHVIVNLGEPYSVLGQGEGSMDRSLPGAFVSGLQSRALVTRNPDRLHHVGAELEPWAWRALGAEPIVNRVVDAAGVLPAVAGLPMRLRRAAPEEAIAVLEEALAAALTSAQVDPAVVEVARRIEADPDGRIGAIAVAAGLDPATAARRFRRATGTTPKAHAQVHRLHRFVSRLAEPGPLPTWTSLVADAAYYDQPHFIHDFVRRVGLTPRAYLEVLGEAGRVAPSFINWNDG